MKRTKHSSLAFRDEFLTGRLGIRSRIILDLTFLVGFIISLVWITQIALLYSFYRNDRETQVNRAANVLVQNIDHEDLDALADRISADNDICLMLLDDSGEQLLSIDHVRYCTLHRMRRKDLEDLVSKAPEDGSGIIRTVSISPFRNEQYRKEHFSGSVPENEQRSGVSMLYARRVRFADGRGGTLLLNAEIIPTAAVLNTLRKQFLYIVLTVFLAAGSLGWIMANGISSPIIETNQAARELSKSHYSRAPHSGGYREIAELNDTLVQAAEDLRKVEMLQRELIANISHDLRTPLTMIQGYAESMRDLPGEMKPENMQVIIDETNRLSSMVNEVLDFSRLQTGPLQLEITEFDLTALADAICERVQIMTAAEGYRIENEVKDPVWVRADSGRIQQVVYNLLGNALTYTGKDKTVRIRGEKRGENFRVSVSDSGAGIDPKELPFIWDRYFRSRESHKRAVIGSGLGLNICRGILENHHVPYGVNSEIGKGTTFWFELPAVNEIKKKED